MERIIIKHQKGSKADITEFFSLADFKDITFGRGRSVKVKYARNRDNLVSRQHARITRDRDNPDQFILIDLKSRNGTFVNKSRISSPYRLHHGDLVQFGSGGPVFAFELDTPIETFSTGWLATLSNIVSTDVSTLLGTDICSGAGAGFTTSPRTGFSVRTLSGTALMSVLLVGWGNVVVFGTNATYAGGTSCCSNIKLIITLAVTNNIQTTIIKS